MPTKFRGLIKEGCEGKMVVTIAVDSDCIGVPGCLWLYPLHEWEVLENTILKLPSLEKTAVRLKRFVIGNAQECDMDNQGRLLIPEQLRRFAEMDKKIVLLGQINKFEVWNEQAWNEQDNLLMDESGRDEIDDKGREIMSSLVL